MNRLSSHLLALAATAFAVVVAPPAPRAQELPLVNVPGREAALTGANAAGSVLVYERSNAAGRTDAWVLDLRASCAGPLRERLTSSGAASSPSVDASGDIVAWAEGDGTGGTAIRRLDRTTGHRSVLWTLSATQPSDVRRLRLSPDGSNACWEVTSGARPEIHLAGAFGHRLVAGELDASALASSGQVWSPDSAWFAYVRGPLARGISRHVVATGADEPVTCPTVGSEEDSDATVSQAVPTAIVFVRTETFGPSADGPRLMRIAALDDCSTLPEEVFEMPRQRRIESAVVSGDGLTAVFSGDLDSGGAFRVYSVLALPGGEPTPLGAVHDPPPAALEVDFDGDITYFAHQGGDGRELFSAVNVTEPSVTLAAGDTHDVHGRPQQPLDVVENDCELVDHRGLQLLQCTGRFRSGFDGTQHVLMFHDVLSDSTSMSESGPWVVETSYGDEWLLETLHAPNLCTEEGFAQLTVVRPDVLEDDADFLRAWDVGCLCPFGC